MRCLLFLGALATSAANSFYSVDDTPGLGLRWEGVGAISGGGATTKLLMDYDPKVDMGGSESAPTERAPPSSPSLRHVC